jgi:hypothetical protein
MAYSNTIKNWNLTHFQVDSHISVLFRPVNMGHDCFEKEVSMDELSRELPEYGSLLLTAQSDY